MEIKAIIFDLDGVIVHTDKFHYKAWKVISDKLGIYFDETINNRLRGVSRMESLDIILEKSQKQYSQKEKGNFAAEKNEIYREFLENMSSCDVADSVRSTLALLRSKAYKLAIGSSSRNAKLILEKTGLTNYFDKISDGNNIENSKPHPEVFLKAAAFLGVPKESCAVVEDAFSGINAAKAANMFAIGIGDACSYEKTDYKIDVLEDLLKIF